MTDSKSTCCGKPVNVFSGDEGTNHWICGACRKACDVVTDLKTADKDSWLNHNPSEGACSRERTVLLVSQVYEIYKSGQSILLAWELLDKAMVEYASDKDKRIKEAESLLRAAHRWLPDNLMTLSGEPNTKQQIGLFLGMDLL